MSGGKLLVVGARPLSLGIRVVRAAKDAGYRTETLGMGSEDHKLDITDTHLVHEFMHEHAFDHIVNTVGVNLDGTIEGKGWIAALETSMRVNYLAQMIMVSGWARYWRDKIKSEHLRPEVKHYVAISSNSARIARAQSGGYCASKAALSMGMRCAARQEATWPLAIYAYEPGWLEGTPMSEAVRTRIQDKGLTTMHRIPGGQAIPPDQVAEMIVRNIAAGGKHLSGCILRVDGGEQ